MLFLMIQLLINGVYSQDELGFFLQCSSYQEYRKCGSNCPMTCDNMNTEVCCQFRCTAGCFCKDGYVQYSKERPKMCVPVDECPRPGFIQFGTTNFPVVEHMKEVSIPVSWTEGWGMNVSVKWRTRNGVAAGSYDYEPVGGTLFFSENAPIQTITVPIKDDTEKETSEAFFVELYDPYRSELRVNRSEAVITILDDDMQPGFFAMQELELTVVEETGIVTVPVSRVQGKDGEISVSYRTVADTAVASSDYVQQVGQLIFQEGETKKEIRITIVDDNDREPNEMFLVELYNPKAGSGVYNFKQMESIFATRITIIDNDMTPGRLQMEFPTLEVDENVGISKMDVVRVGGSDGELSVRYRTVDESAIDLFDYVPSQGQLTFLDGETRKSIYVPIKNDLSYEKPEKFRVVLFDVSAGTGVRNFYPTEEGLVTTVTIFDDDAMPGYLEVQDSITVRETDGKIVVPINRVNGSDGLMRAKYKTVPGTAVEGYDYIEEHGEVIFVDQQKQQNVEIILKDDSSRESLEVFYFQLYDVSAEGDVSFRSKSPDLTTAIRIVDDDAKPGVFQFELSQISVSEQTKSVPLKIVRLNGADGVVVIQLRVFDKTAKKGSDYNIREESILFQDGLTEKIVFIDIADDDVREGDEEFIVGLFNPDNGGILGNMNTVTITILDKIVPSVVEFRRRSITVPENIGKVVIPVVRRKNIDARVVVHWKIQEHSALIGQDFLGPTKQFLIFEPGETEANIVLTIFDDDIVEGDESFDIILYDPSPEAVLGVLTKLTVNIEDNDRRASTNSSLTQTSGSQVSFAKKKISVDENAGVVEIHIKRTGDMEPFVTYITTVEGTATGNKDYRNTRGAINFDRGDSEKWTAVRIIDDDEIEEDETFTVILVNSSHGSVPPETGGVVITILDDDSAFEGRRSKPLYASSNYSQTKDTMPQLIPPRPSIVPSNPVRNFYPSPSYRQIGTQTPFLPPIQSTRQPVFVQQSPSGCSTCNYMKQTLPHTQSLPVPPTGRQYISPQPHTRECPTCGLLKETVPQTLPLPNVQRHPVLPQQPVRGCFTCDLLKQISTQAPPLLRNQNISPPTPYQPPVRECSTCGLVKQTLPETLPLPNIPRSGQLSRGFLPPIRNVSLQQYSSQTLPNVPSAVSVQQTAADCPTCKLLNQGIPPIPPLPSIPSTGQPVRKCSTCGIALLTSSASNTQNVFQNEETARSPNLPVPVQIEGRMRSIPQALTEVQLYPDPRPHFSRIQSRCPEGQIWRECYQTCPLHCYNMHRRLPCRNTGCISGCYCRDGYVKETRNSSNCVLPSQCPSYVQLQSTTELAPY